MKKTVSVLKSIDNSISLKVPKEFKPKDFFISRKGLYVFSSFESNILVKAESIKKGSAFEISSFELIKTADDKKIEDSLSKDHIFSETDVCAIIASLIEKQPKGEEGILLNNGYANLFYTHSRVVHVFWNAGFGEWLVYVWFRDGYSWLVGHRVFSPATDA